MKKLLILLALGAVVVVGWSFFRHRAPAPADEVEQTVARVETAVVRKQQIAQSIEVFGLVTAAPSGERVTSAPFDCIVQRISVAVGTSVGAGDLLMEVEPSPEAKLAYDATRNSLALSEKALASVRERFDLKLATSQDLLAAQQAMDDARLKVSSLAARGFAGDGRITALSGGVVSKLDAIAGALVPQGAALVTVSAAEQREIRLGVEAADVAAIHSGQTVVAESVNRSHPEQYSTVVRAVGASLDGATGAAEVRAPVPAEAPLLLGEHVRAFVEIARKEDALVVPRSAVLPEADTWVLFTVQNGKATRRVVKIGLTTDDTTEITGDSLHAGDTVVTSGNYELEDGMAVEKDADVIKGTPETEPEKKP